MTIFKEWNGTYNELNLYVKVIEFLTLCQFKILGTVQVFSNKFPLSFSDVHEKDYWEQDVSFR